MNLHLSVITPTYNEKDSILHCINRLRQVMEQNCPGIEYEHIIIDNCSSDRTAEIAIEASKGDSRIKVVVNSRNIGASRSIYRALSRVSGKWIIPMLPADLQDPPEVIPLMLDRAIDGVEVVYGIRTNRKERLLIRSLRKIYYRVLKKYSPFNLQNDAGEFMLVSSRVIDSITAIRDQNPYVRGLVAQTGAKFASIPYQWNERESGKSKSSVFVLADVAVSGMVSTTYIPARISLVFGFTISFLGVLAGVVYLILAMLSSKDVPAGIPTLTIAIFLLGGFQLFFLGLIGEYVISIHRQIKPETDVTSMKESNF
jgi:glycosyltransferase involved in cell wall biosynthesis